MVSLGHCLLRQVLYGFFIDARSLLIFRVRTGSNISLWHVYLFIYLFFVVVENTKYFKTHTHRTMREVFKETDSSVYLKGPNS